MIKLDIDTLVELGNFISDKVEEIKPHETTLLFKVDSYSFRKIDEDIFYRFQGEDKKEEYVPSDDEIILRFPNVNIKIEKDNNVEGVMWNNAIK